MCFKCHIEWRVTMCCPPPGSFNWSGMEPFIQRTTHLLVRAGMISIQKHWLKNLKLNAEVFLCVSQTQTKINLSMECCGSVYMWMRDRPIRVWLGVVRKNVMDVCVYKGDFQSIHYLKKVLKNRLMINKQNKCFSFSWRGINKHIFLIFLEWNFSRRPLS